MIFRRHVHDEHLRLKAKAGVPQGERSFCLALGNVSGRAAATMESADRKDRNYPVASFIFFLFSFPSPSSGVDNKTTTQLYNQQHIDLGAV